MFSHHFSALAATVLVLSGCAGVANSSQETFKSQGETGRLVVFTANQSQDTAGILLDNRFISGLNANQYVSQEVCEGEYSLRVRSLYPHSQMNQHLKEEESSGVLKVENGETVYVEAVRKRQGWQLQVADKTRFDALNVSIDNTSRDENIRVIRRLLYKTVQCN